MNTSIIGRLLVVAVLAVPSFLFYNWWTSRKNEAAVQASVQSVSTATIFADTQDKPSAQPAVQASTAAEGSAFQPAPVQRAVQSQPVLPISSAAPMAASEPSGVVRSTAADQGSGTPSAPVSTRTAPGSYFSPGSDRDPTMTPGDYQRIKDEERARIENERQRQLALRKQLRESGGENRIKLQGVVGNSVIINGEMYSVGDTVAGVKILKIGSDYLIGEYKGKRFKKILQ